MKPNGLWVSDEDEFGWRSWCIEENFRLDMLTHVHEVTLSNTANILVLETPGLIREFTIDHGREQPRPSGRRGACWRGSGRRCGGSDLGHRSRSAARRLTRSERTRIFLIDAREACRYGRTMTAPPEPALMRELRARIQELEHQNTDLARQVADLERHNKELREAVAALLAPDGNGPDAASQMKVDQR